MLIVHVHVHVKPDQVEAFTAATIENARNSVQEPGIARFDIISKKMIRDVLSWLKSIARRKTPPGTRKRHIIKSGGIPSRI